MEQTPHSAVRNPQEIEQLLEEYRTLRLDRSAGTTAY